MDGRLGGDGIHNNMSVGLDHVRTVDRGIRGGVVWVVESGFVLKWHCLEGVFVSLSY